MDEEGITVGTEGSEEELVSERGFMREREKEIRGGYTPPSGIILITYNNIKNNASLHQS